ncbi:chlorophyll synthase ChlG [Histidinibacterium aquaticum]|uniref:Chlorophyll synthase ChlG n=1 Tax=Histidinibacterium aquaticum TaxID=2613962 RepID=A0A5J5GF37_9RHOB|nr:chlorophyll synthase ChlG [Histidinibacterium aquaticum]KAA9006866.1 chlorophyll synthase ChlG [Histidinibacterium aquaticum]
MSATPDIAALEARRWPEPRAALQLIKPITWFPPMWAFACGAVSSGGSLSQGWGLVLLGILLAGPIVCGMSQAANDWCDRHVDAINEPDRPIPSGRIPGRWGLWIALAMSALSLLVGWQLGPWGFGATVAAVLAAWAYSAEPVRLKRSGWWGPGLVGLSYETLPWITGAAVLSAGAPAPEVLLVALLYGIGAHGIMTLNDFKALEGDRQTGVNSLPVTLGPERAARLACAVMALPQAVVVGLLAFWDRPWHALAVAGLLLLQALAMRTLLRDPKGKAPWYNGTGVLLYITGMMIAATALRGLGV